MESYVEVQPIFAFGAKVVQRGMQLGCKVEILPNLIFINSAGVIFFVFLHPNSEVLDLWQHPEK